MPIKSSPAIDPSPSYFRDSFLSTRLYLANVFRGRNLALRGFSFFAKVAIF